MTPPPASSPQANRSRPFGADAGGGVTRPFPKPLEMEIGCGKGRFILDRARVHPAVHFVGVERAAKFAKIAEHRARQRGLRNLHIVKGDAREIVRYDLAPASTAAFHVYFPDPWPKRRHRKRRLLNPEFLELLHDRLQAGGTIEYATDFRNYFDELKAITAGQSKLWSRIRVSINEPLLSDAERTNYEMKYRREGRTLYYLELVKCG